jgi:hypothetical protein
MSSTTGDHNNELEARRQRRRGRQAPSIGDANTPRGSKPAEEARDLLRDLITNGPPQGQDAPIASDVAGVTGSQKTREHLTSGASATEQPEPETHREGERVDALVRRVQASAQTVAADAAPANRKRRPTATADLSADAALRSRPPRRSRRRSIQAASHATRWKLRHPKWLAAVTVLAAGVVLVTSLDGVGGRHAAASRHGSSSSTQLDVASPAQFGRALRGSVAVIDRDLRAAARVAAARVRPALRAAKHTRRRSRPHAANVRHRTPARGSQSASVASPSTTSSQSQTYKPAQTPVTNAGQSSATAQPSSASSSQPAGPTDSGPLGGIGSCVKGCT